MYQLQLVLLFVLLQSEQFFNLYIYIYIYIYIYNHLQTDCFIVSQLFSVARHMIFSKLGTKPSWLICQLKILPHSREGTSVSEGILNTYVSYLFCFAYIHLTATKNSIHLRNLDLRNIYPRFATLIEVFELQEEQFWKINFIWSHSMRESWLA